MPVGVVKTPEDEKHWTKAKAIAKKQGKGKNWGYVMGVFQKMKGEDRARRLVNALLEDEVEEMTTTGDIATAPMGLGTRSDYDSDEVTPKDPEIADSPVDLGPGRKV